MTKAPRLAARLWHSCARGVWLAAGLSLAGAAAAQTQMSAPCLGAVESVGYDLPTDRYRHGVLGDDLEWGALTLRYLTKESCASARGQISVELPDTLVFEDVAPRLVDLDGQGHVEVIVVESHKDKGARLAVWGLRGDAFLRVAATPFIGTRFRWLAPLGAADLDGDGVIELAYVDRPHLARILRIWRYETAADGTATLREVAAASGVTNHRIGERDIAGGIHNCGQGPEMIVADAAWRAVLALRFDGQAIVSETLGAHRGRESFARAMRCEPLR